VTQVSPAEAVFFAALAKVDPAERAAYLNEACGTDADLRRQVERLLAAHPQVGSFLQDDAAAHPSPLGGMGRDVRGGATVDAPVAEAPGTVIGPYKLLKQLGEGGMGTVFLAEQSQPVQRKVALKVIKSGMDSHQVIARFEAERQALALMDHPNIARVLDAGTTAGGRPYFVMELVKGVPITRYCDEHHLTPKQRLELFVPVCQAVQHAHQKGIIHRDLKPSNVLVCLYDGHPVPKVIDFGVAKAAGPKLTEKTLFTEVGSVVGTLEYMSPEQAELNQLDIDTRSDIYSLGVVLYELLTGTTPLERKRFKEAAFLEVLRLIREEEPPRPSTRLSESKDSLPSISAQRQTEPAKLTRLVRGELDWIVMKALEKDRNRRYETANGFALDVQRYLADEPVEACPPSAGYRIGKFVRRNRGPVLAAGVFVLLLAAGVAGTAAGLVRALAAERAAGDALAQATAEQAKTQAALTAESAAKARTREALDVLTAGVVRTMFAKQPELGEAEKAFLRKVLEFYEAFTQEAGGTAEARSLRAKGYFQVASLHSLLGEQREAAAGYRQAEDVLGRLADEFPEAPEYRENLGITCDNLGVCLAELGDEAGAETAFNKSVAAWKKLADDSPKTVPYIRGLAAARGGLASLRRMQAKYEDALEGCGQALGLMEKVAAEADAVPSDRQSAARMRSNLAQLLGDLRRYAEAKDAYDQAVMVQEKALAELPAVPQARRELAESYHGLGVVLAESGKEEDAAPVFQQAIDLQKRLAEEFPNVHRYRQELALTYGDLGRLQDRRHRYGDAEAAYRRAVEWGEKAAKESGGAPGDREALGRSLAGLGGALANQQKVADAEQAYGQALPHQRKLVDDFPRVPQYRDELVDTLVRLAMLHMQRREFADALTLLEQARLHLEAALEVAPKDPTSRRFYRDRLRVVAQIYFALADHARVAAAADELARFGYDPANDAMDGMIWLCGCAAMAEKDDTLTEARRGELIESYARRALALLRRAVENGFKDVARLKQDPRLALLRARDEFKELLADLEGKSKE
jgi:serine/threonine protein kinase/tetratricopeptide (TPR) repeat protein